MNNILNFIIIFTAAVFSLYFINKITENLLRKYYAKNWVERSAKKHFLGLRQLDYIRLVIIFISVTFAKLLIYIINNIIL